MSHMDPYLTGGRRAIKIRYAYPGYAEGGRVNTSAGDDLMDDAEDVRKAGRHGDTILVHVNPEEFERMRGEFGEPLINPETGIPEWGWKDSLKKLVKKVAPILTAASFMPGMQGLAPLSAVSNAASMIPGVTKGGALAKTIGGGILGALGGGKEGAVRGALGSFATSSASPMQSLGARFMPNASPATQAMLARGGLGAAAAALTGRKPLEGALGSVMLGRMADDISGSDFVQKGLGGVLQQGALGGAKGLELAGLMGTDPVRSAAVGASLGAADRALQKFRNASPQSSGALSALSPMVLESMPLLVNEFAQYKTKDEALQKISAEASRNPDQRPIYDAMEKFTVCDLSSDFGACMAQNWDAFMRSVRTNAPSVANMAEGGSVLQALTRTRLPESDFAYEGMVRGPGDGQSDSVPINAARNEYVFPADAVSAIGNGSSEAGAEELDEVVRNIRKRARSGPVDRNPPKAKSVLEYLGE